MTTQTEHLLTLDEAGEYLRCGRTTLYDLVRRGELVKVAMGGRTRFTKDDLDIYIERRRRVAVAQTQAGAPAGASTRDDTVPRIRRRAPTIYVHPEELPPEAGAPFRTAEEALRIRRLANRLKRTYFDGRQAS